MKIDKNNSSKAFTLIELLVVISIIGMLSSIILATLSGVREKGTLASGQTFDRHTYGAWYEDLVLAWDFDTDSGTTVQDQTGNGNNLTLTDTTSLVTDSNYNPFKNGKVLDIVNTSKTAVTGSPINSPTPIVNDFSISLWIYPRGGEFGSVEIISNFYSPLAAGKWMISIQDGGKLSFLARSNINSGFSPSVPQILIKSGQWYHAMAVCNGTKGTLYVNGKVATDSKLLSSGGNCSYLSTVPIIMNARLLNGSVFPYYVDNVRIYNKAFTVAMAEELYLAEKDKFDNLAIGDNGKINNK